MPPFEGKQVPPAPSLVSSNVPCARMVTFILKTNGLRSLQGMTLTLDLRRALTARSAYMYGVA